LLLTVESAKDRQHAFSIYVAGTV